MPEGHSVHRIARQFERTMIGRTVRATSPQGRFAVGAAEIDGRTLTASRAVGKQMFLQFGEGVWLRVHLGMYGAWDFAGAVASDESMGAPRRSRVRMAEDERFGSESEAWPPEPVGQVRLRLLTDDVCADLRGPTACEVMNDAGMQAVLNRLGPDPLNDTSEAAEDRFVAAVRKRRVAIGLLLMDQSVVSGIGNVYRAELLYRARLNPHLPGTSLGEETIRSLWRDWNHLLRVGVDRGVMLTIDGLDGAELRAALADRADRHWVYKREGLPCRTCGSHIVLEELATRKLYWCPSCQAAPGTRRRRSKVAPERHATNRTRVTS